MKVRLPSVPRSLEWAGFFLLLLVLLTGGRWLSSLGNRVEAEGQSSAAVLPLEAAGPLLGPDDGPLGPEGTGDGAALLRQAFEERRSGLVVQGRGIVARMLPDEVEGARHQRFVLRLSDGRALPFAHDIDVALRVPLVPGDEVGFRGRYEWSAEGGSVHGTHHDPRGRQPGGWLEHDGRRYE